MCIVHFRHLPLIPCLLCSNHVHPLPRCNGLCGLGGDPVFFVHFRHLPLIPCLHAPIMSTLYVMDYVVLVVIMCFLYISDTCLSYLAFAAPIMSTLHLDVMDYVILVVIMCFIVHFRHLLLLPCLRCSHHVHPPPRRNGLCGPGGDHVFYCTFQTPSFATLPSLLPSCPPST